MKQMLVWGSAVPMRHSCLGGTADPGVSGVSTQEQKSLGLSRVTKH